MINFKRILHNNLLLKITSLNTLLITVRLIISLIVQRLLAVMVGELGIAKIGQLRNLIQIITSTSSLGTFNGVVKYISEFRDDGKKLTNLFTTVISFVFFGSAITSIVIYFFASWITIQLFGNLSYINLIKSLALIPVTIGLNRVFYGVINGLTEYKKYAKIDLLSYVLSSVLLIILLYLYGLKGVLFSIIISPIIQFSVILYIFGTTLKKHIKIEGLGFKIPFVKELLAFSLMSFVSTILLNYVELDLRTTITNKINIDEAGNWTAMSFISKNYMAFSSGLFTLYVIPKFARIYEYTLFKKEVITIYKTILPLFGIGMLLVYIFRNFIIDIIYPNFSGLEPLFKWQLLGDFVRLATLVISHQFLAKKMVRSFIFTEIVSLGLFYFISKYFVTSLGAEGVVIAHFYRYILYFGLVVFVVWGNFYIKKTNVK